MRAFAVAAGLLALVIAVGAVTGASPRLEGAVVKPAFLTGLGWASSTSTAPRVLAEGQPREQMRGTLKRFS